MSDILTFSGENRWASNFEGPEIRFGDLWFPRPEHAYQGAKTLILKERMQFTDPILTAGEAKKLGYKVTIRADWDKIKFCVMNIVVRQKFLHMSYLSHLLKTEDSLIVEGNTWHDNYWGACSCSKCTDKPKLNNLGKILMNIRTDMEAWKVCTDQEWAIKTAAAGPHLY